MRCQPAENARPSFSVVNAQEHVRAEVRRRPLPEHGRLDLMQVETRRVRRNIAADGFLTDDMGASFLGSDHSGPDPTTSDRSGYATLSRNSSTALPIFFSRWISATVRSGWATYQPSAVIWCFTR